MEDAIILSGIRTPIGRYAGSLKDVRPDDLAALVIAEAIKRARVEPDSIEDVILGCANQAGEDNRNVARMALLLAGLPITVAGQTVNRLCASGMSACIHASRMIQTGDADLIIGGGGGKKTRGPWGDFKKSTTYCRH